MVQKEDTSILILSDDSALNEDIDANALGNLVYVRDIINTKKKPTIVLGYIKPGEEIVLFNGDQSEIQIQLSNKDKIIVFSNH